jgi:hypothetical protein
MNGLQKAEPGGVALRHNGSHDPRQLHRRARAKPTPSGPLHRVAGRRTAACATSTCRHPRSRPVVTLDHWVELHGYQTLLSIRRN